jgi:tetratricopeptide (TPR) repeat protein
VNPQLADRNPAMGERFDAALDDPRRRAAWYYWTGFLHSLTGGKPEVAIAYCREAAATAEEGGFEEITAYAECCLGQVYQVRGELREALNAGERALEIFERRGNVWWACRTLWGLNTAALYLGDWARALDYSCRALEHGRTVDDLRLKVVGWSRLGSTHVHRGDHLEGLRCLDEAQALSPIEFDAAMIKVARGHALIKAGNTAAAIAEIAEAVAWFDRSHLSYGRAMGVLRLAEGYLRAGDRSHAQKVLDDVLAVSREVGYRYFEGRAQLLLAECVLIDDPERATNHLGIAKSILTEVGARNDLGKVLLVEAELRRRASDLDGARASLGGALEIFEDLGSRDEASRARFALTRLDS